MIPLGAWPRTAAERIAQDLEFIPIILSIFFGLSASWWSFAAPRGGMTRVRWRTLIRITGGVGLGSLAMLGWLERTDILRAVLAVPLGVGLAFAAELGCSAALLIFPWKWGSEPDTSPPLGLDMDAAAAAAPRPLRARARARLTVANAYAWLIVAAVAYIGIRWLLRHV